MTGDFELPNPYRPPHANLQSGAVLYSVQGIVIATIIGSLAAAVAMLWLNYRNLNAPALADKTAIVGMAVYLLLIAVGAMLPETLVLALLLMGLQAAIAYFAATALQGPAIRYHREQGGMMHSNFRAAGIGLLVGLAIMIVILLLATLVTVIAPA